MIKDTARILSGISPNKTIKKAPIKKARVKKPKKGHQVHLATILREAAAFKETVHHIHLSRKVDEQDLRLLEEAKDSYLRMERSYKAIEQRANQILRAAAKECGVKVAWQLNIPRNYLSFQKDMLALRVSFTLSYTFRDGAKFLRSPLHKVMPLEFPLSWLDASPSELRLMIRERLR